MTYEESITWIDSSDYYTLLSKWRFAESGDPLFVDDVGKYFGQVLIKKREALPPGRAVEISKAIGCERL